MTTLDPASIKLWRSAIGRSETRTEVLVAEPLRRFALALGSKHHLADAPPPLGHWAFFLPQPADGEIGVDGHPRRGGFLPDITLPRRMYAASRMEFAAPLRLEQPAELTTTIADVSHKAGRTGDLIFVDVERVVTQNGEMCVSETQSYVYRHEGEPVPLPQPARDEPQGERWMPTEVNLFRFSAATFNGHRIHYDLPYATRVEGYPALVVHGPFTAARLAGLAMRDGPLVTFAFRAMAPLFLGQPIYLRAAGTGAVEAVRCDGAVAMRAEFACR